MRKLDGLISQDTNSCFKYKIRPFNPAALQKEPEPELQKLEEEVKGNQEEQNREQERQEIVEDGGNQEFPEA